MKRAIVILLSCLPFLMVTAQSEQTKSIVFVQADADGDGSSWDSPAGDLQEVLQNATAGQTIWVAAGTYLPTTSTDRTIAFEIPNGVKLYGGFAGYESTIDERDFMSNVSVLSGEIGKEGFEDNSYTVVFTKGVNEETVVDGFTITGGNADRKVLEGNLHSCGGGWFNDATAVASSPQILNCTFENNRAYFGGGLYNNAKGGSSEMLIDYCAFLKNNARIDGGGVLNNGTEGDCNIKITYTRFIENEAYYGAGILNKAKVSGEASPYIQNAHFEKNLAFMKGSSIYNLRTGDGISNPVMINCLSIEGHETVRTPESRSVEASKTKSGASISSSNRR